MSLIYTRTSPVIVKEKSITSHKNKTTGVLYIIVHLFAYKTERGKKNDECIKIRFSPLN